MKLYIFSTSLNPDVYINPIVHCANDEGFQSKRVELVVIFENKQEEEKRKESYKNTQEKIINVLGHLASGVYQTESANNQLRKVELKNDEKQLYYSSRIKNKEISFTTITYDNLAQKIDEIIKIHSLNSEKSPRCIFDVSGERKFLLVDILFICLGHGFTNIYTFDMIKAPDFKNKDRNLIHSLGNNDYKFRNLIEDSNYVKESISKLKNYKDFDRLLKNNAVRFANFVLFGFILFFLAFLGLIYCAFPFLKENWIDYQPYIYITIAIVFGVVLWLIKAIFVLVYKIEFSFTPKKLWSNLKDYKRKELNEKYNFIELPIW